MEKTRKLEDIQCGVQQIQTKLSKLKEERNQFLSVATEMLKRNEQLLDDFISERKEELKKAMSKLEGEKEELLFQQRRLELQNEEKEEKNGD